jgi:SAM-dependent methyltransferase
MSVISWLLGQCRQPHGRVGRLLAREMNRVHRPMTAWILSEVPLSGVRAILDLGCGGGGTVRGLADLVPKAEIHGIDYSAESVLVASRINRDLIAQGRVFVRLGSVSDLPYDGGEFDLALAIESHYFWPDLPSDLAEVRRVLAPGGMLVVGGGVYYGGRHDARNRRLARAGAMNCMTLPELAEVLRAAGYVDIVERENPRKGWFWVGGTSPLEGEGADLGWPVIDTPVARW